MNTEFEVYPVTSDEVVRILGLLNMEEIELFLDDIKAFQERLLLNRALVLLRPTSKLKEKRKPVYAIQ
jgi:hypothetical protein